MVDVLPSEHCPGSVMFLFYCPFDKKRVLYTGDFRVEDESKWRLMRALHSVDDDAGGGSSPRVLPIDTIHVDTTFCMRECKSLWSRDQSADAFVAMALKWLKQSSGHQIQMKLPANIGHEDLLVRLAEKWDMV